MILPMNYSRTSSDTRMTAADMNRICSNVNEICGASLKNDWTSDDIVDEATWYSVCDLAAALGRYTITYGTDYRNVNRIERSLFEQYDETAHITATAKLTSLSISNGTLSPAFNSGTYAYTATVSDASSVITATTDYSAIAYVVNGATVDPAHVVWQNGSNELKVKATLNGVTRVYTVTVTCTYQAAELLTLSIGGDAVTISDYMTLTSENASDNVAYTSHGTVTLELNGEAVTGPTLNWRENDNVLKITVTASNTKVYTLAVDCLYVTPIPAYLSAINISDAIMAPRFAGGTLAYDVYPEGDTSTITAIIDSDADVAVYFNGTEIINGSEIEWDENGGDVITVTTSGTGFISQTYTITGHTAITTEPLAPMKSGEIIAGDNLPGEAFE